MVIGEIIMYKFGLGDIVFKSIIYGVYNEYMMLRLESGQGLSEVVDWVIE